MRSGSHWYATFACGVAAENVLSLVPRGRTCVPDASPGRSATTSPAALDTGMQHRRPPGAGNTGALTKPRNPGFRYFGSMTDCNGAQVTTLPLNKVAGPFGSG